MNQTLTLFFKYFSRALMLLLVMPLTNSAKGLVAKWLGDDTAERNGRINLNPMAHLDPIGSLMILLCGFGWSKPMPINTARMRDFRKGTILISLTGPLTHFLSAIVCNFFNQLISLKASPVSGNGISLAYCIYIVLMFLANINVCLGVISLLPLPPLDGFEILRQLAGTNFNKWYFTNQYVINRASTIILFSLFFMGTITNGLFDPLSWLIGLVSNLLSLATAWVPAVFG